jgi:hypothetical protein
MWQFYVTNVFGRVDETTNWLLMHLIPGFKIIYEQQYLAQKNKARTLSHTSTNMAGEKNDILCDE